MAEVRWTELAIEDLQDIFEYISRDSVAYASQHVNTLHDRTNQLEHQPDSGRIVPEFGHKFIRELIEGNYRIIYRLESQSSVTILRIHHSARLLSEKDL